MAHPNVVERDDWQTCESGWRPPGGGLDLWWLDLTRPPLGQTALASLLSETESAEIAGFHRPEDRLQRAAARAFLRFVLGTHYLDCAPREVRWTRDPHGRPLLAHAGTANIDFNLSHAGSHVLLGVSMGGRIGVDVEIAGAVEVAALARICATESERHWLAAARDESEERSRFFRLWTMKEAVLKCHGLGLGFDPRHCELDPERDHARLQVPGGKAGTFTLVALPFAPGVVGAVAWPGDEETPLRQWRAANDWIVA